MRGKGKKSDSQSKGKVRYIINLGNIFEESSILLADL